MEILSTFWCVLVPVVLGGVPEETAEIADGREAPDDFFVASGSDGRAWVVIPADTDDGWRDYVAIGNNPAVRAIGTPVPAKAIACSEVEAGIAELASTTKCLWAWLGSAGEWQFYTMQAQRDPVPNMITSVLSNISTRGAVGLVYEGRDTVLRQWFREPQKFFVLTIRPDFTGCWAWLGVKGSPLESGLGEGVEASRAGGFPNYGIPFSPALSESFENWKRSYELPAYDAYCEDKPFDLDWDLFHGQGLDLARQLKREISTLATVVYEKPWGDPNRDVNPRVLIE